jgi:EAL domain-containing protein (putative c-di-GMP-specific phosphodiesterase class I)
VLSLGEINEVYGREAGNDLLSAFSDFLSGNIPDAVVYRISGGKFCITIHKNSPEELNAIAEELFKKLEEPWKIICYDVPRMLICKFTVGVIYSHLLKTDDASLNIVDRMFKFAKSSMRRVVFYNDDMVRELRRRKQLEYSLKSCVANNMEGFEVFYQPIVDPVTEMWRGVEALCRWRSPELGFVSPAEFIIVAERLGLIEVLGLWVLETSIRQCRLWGLDQSKSFVLDVNLSAHQFLDIHLADKILHIIKENEYPGENLCLEITESTQFTFSGHTMKTFDQLKEANILIALDDFGTGYSAFNKLKDMPVNIVKIERSFVMNIESDSYMRFLFNSIAKLAHAADMIVVAEGVETVEQMSILLDNGADLLQGYLFSKPVHPDEIELMINRFHETDPTLMTMQKQITNINSLLSPENDLDLSADSYRLLIKCVHILLSGYSAGEALDEVLALVGKHLNVSRTYIFLRESDNIYSNKFEWCNEGISSQMEMLTNFPVMDSFIDILKRDKSLVSHNISDLPKDIYDTLNVQGIRSILIFPIMEGGDLTGFMGYDECMDLRHWWWPEEILMLYNLSLIIAGILNKTGGVK